MSKLIHIVYMSFSSRNLSEEELDDFLTLIRKKNQTRGVTGLLLYNDETFIQIIEGYQDSIDELFEIISKDNKHTNILKLLEEPIDKRAFPDWSMGFRRLSQIQKNNIPGYFDFIQGKQSNIDSLECSQAVKQLLLSFKKHT